MTLQKKDRNGGRFAPDFARELKQLKQSAGALATAVGSNCLFTIFDGDERSAVESAGDGASKLLALLNDADEIDYLESDRRPKANVEFDVDELLSHIQHSSADVAERGNIRIVARRADGAPKLVTGDVTLLTKILLILTGTAVESARDGSIEITVASAPSRSPLETTLYFTISGAARGRSRERQLLLFTPAATPNRPSGSYGGSAVSDAQQLLGQLGSTLQITADQDNGATLAFEMRVPNY